MPEKFTIIFTYCGKSRRYVIEQFKERYWIVRFGSQVEAVVDTLEEAFREFSDVVDYRYYRDEVNL